MAVSIVDGLPGLFGIRRGLGAVHELPARLHPTLHHHDTLML